MNRISFICLLLCLTILGARPAQTQTQTLLYEFQGSPDGATPEGNLIPYKGHLYGVTAAGGTGDSGTVFELSPNGTGGWNEAVLYNFCFRPSCIDGSIPTLAYVIFDSHGNMYGTTWTGGLNNHGVVWELSRSQAHWKETVLYRFRHGNGVSGLVMDSSGNLYGCTYDGPRASTVFELSPSQGGWTEKTILKIDETYSGLAIDGAGNLFGSTLSYVFELSPNGSGGWSGSIIHNFKANEDGEFEIPTLDSAGNIYGTTESGGQTDQGAVWRLTPVKSGSSNKSWTEQLIYSFKGTQKDGSFPYGGVVLDAAGNIYGTTLGGGVEERGTVYELSPVSGGKYSETFLWGFNITDGASPDASLILDSSGNLYGTALAGGSNSAGVVFELTP